MPRDYMWCRVRRNIFFLHRGRRWIYRRRFFRVREWGMTSIPWRQIIDACIYKSELVARTLLPNGKRSGDWWKVRSPFRSNDKNPSFAVSLTTGWWRDYGTGDKGDMIDLCSRLRGLSREDAALQLAEIVGIRTETTENDRKRQETTRKRREAKKAAQEKYEAIGR